MYTVHTRNTGLLDAPLLADPHSHDPANRIPVAFNQYVPDHQWLLYCDGRPVMREPREIAPTVAADIRKAICEHQRRHPLVPGSTQQIALEI